MIIEQLHDGAGITKQQAGLRQVMAHGVTGASGCRSSCGFVEGDRVDRFAIEDVAEEVRGLLQVGYADARLATVMSSFGVTADRHAAQDEQQAAGQRGKKGLAHGTAPVTVLVA